MSSVKRDGQLTISDLVREAHDNAVRHGFYDDWNAAHSSGNQQLINNAVSSRLMLTVSELGEALEALRHNDQANFREELADVMIRVADLAGAMNIDLEGETVQKMERNISRPPKHGKLF